MKIVLLLSGFCALFSACEDPIIGYDNELVYLHSFITYYDGSPIRARAQCNDHGKMKIALDTRLSGPGQYFQSPETGGEGVSSKKFQVIAQRNGDCSYNRNEYFLSYIKRMCYASNITDIQVVCKNKEWDQNHPAGISLNDLVQVEAVSYAPYVRRGYEGVQRTPIRKFLTALEDADLSMIEPDFSLYLDGSPAPGSYEIEIRMTTSDGELLTTTCLLPVTLQRSKSDHPTPFHSRK